MEDKYKLLVGSLNELLQDKEEILLRGYDTKPLTNKIKKAETKQEA